MWQVQRAQKPGGAMDDQGNLKKKDFPKIKYVLFISSSYLIWLSTPQIAINMLRLWSFRGLEEVTIVFRELSVEFGKARVK